MIPSGAQAAAGRSPATTDLEQTQLPGILRVSVAGFWLDLWTVATEAMFLAWNTTPLGEEERTALGTQLGDLLRYLARRHIYPIDQTSETVACDDRPATTPPRKDVIL